MRTAVIHSHRHAGGGVAASNRDRARRAMRAATIRHAIQAVGPESVIETLNAPRPFRRAALELAQGSADQRRRRAWHDLAEAPTRDVADSAALAL